MGRLNADPNDGAAMWNRTFLILMYPNFIIVRPKLNVPLTGNLDYTILVSFPANGVFYEKAL